nr:hypothetical protein [Mucilaginibacter sp. L294]
MDRQIEQRAANTLLDKGVSVSFRAPLFLRLFGKKRINTTIGNPTGGTYLQLTICFLKMMLSDTEMADMNFGSLLNHQVKYHKTVYRAVACALLNSRWLRWPLTRPLAWMLADVLPYKTACRLFEVLIVQGGVEDFTNIIGLGARLNMTTAKTSQTSDHTS